MSFIKNIIYYCLSLQEKMLTKSLNRTLGVKNSAKRKKFFTQGCSLSLDSLAETDRLKMEEELSIILKSSNFDPIQILDYIKKHDTKIFYIKNSKHLNSIGENEGFIYPQKGTRALYLSLLTEHKFKLKTPEMFVLSKGDINQYYFIYHFYNWYAFKHNIIGIDSETQKLLTKFLINSSEEEIKKLQLADIYKLKDAIKQDKSAIEFVFKLCQQFEGSKKALDKIKNNGARI